EQRDREQQRPPPRQPLPEVRHPSLPIRQRGAAPAPLGVQCACFLPIVTEVAMAATRTITTMCPMNCHPTYCGMRVTVDGERVVAVAGDPDNPDSRGFLCARGRAAHEIRDNPRRLLAPLRRIGPRG